MTAFVRGFWILWQHFTGLRAEKCDVIYWQPFYTCQIFISLHFDLNWFDWKMLENHFKFFFQIVWQFFDIGYCVASIFCCSQLFPFSNVRYVKYPRYCTIFFVKIITYNLFIGGLNVLDWKEKIFLRKYFYLTNIQAYFFERLNKQ